MVLHQHINRKEFAEKIRNGKIVLGGNLNLKIYGLLNCSSGKRMKKVNRVFFANEEDAITMGFRPCGNCMTHRYREWKTNH
jgi:methylphosphotriester-DNA--protein-cysteine methyltransferase